MYHALHERTISQFMQHWGRNTILINRDVNKYNENEDLQWVFMCILMFFHLVTKPCQMDVMG